MNRFRERASLYRTSLDPSALAALQGCHFIITISGLSVALQPLITLSLSHRLAPALVSRSLQLPHVHVRRFSSSWSTEWSRSLSLESPPGHVRWLSSPQPTGGHVRRLSRFQSRSLNLVMFPHRALIAPAIVRAYRYFVYCTGDPHTWDC